MEFVIIAIVGAGLAVGILVVLYRAISNVFDWAILTFGNEDAVRRRKAEQDEGEHDR